MHTVTAYATGKHYNLLNWLFRLHHVHKTYVWCCLNATSHMLDIFCRVKSVYQLHVNYMYFSTIVTLENISASCNIKRNT